MNMLNEWMSRMNEWMSSMNTLSRQNTPISDTGGIFRV